MRPLYRDDIFYSGSLVVLPEYKKSLAGHSASVNQSYTQRDVGNFISLNSFMNVTNKVTRQKISNGVSVRSCNVMHFVYLTHVKIDMLSNSLLIFMSYQYYNNVLCLLLESL